jgi:UDP-N-acetylenolpyruvoylglucosamine reductase
MEGIPGNVGGSLRMNAGAMGWETFDQVVSVRMVDAEGQVFEKPLEEIRHHYRNVPELAHNVAVSAVFRGEPKPDAEIAETMELSKSKRRSSQPVAASAGCIFKNPESIGAGQLIDEMGMKNEGIGQAKVSEVHGNFIVNEGKATARQVLDLITAIKKEAHEKRGIELETEVQIIGQDEPIGMFA